MESFKYVKSGEVHLIPLNQVLIGKPMIRATIENKDFFPNCLNLKEFLIDIGAPNLGNLNRLKNFFDIESIYPPVTLLKLDFGYYSIIDGRHRATMSILNGYKYIPAIIK